MQECDGVSKKCGRNVRASAGRGGRSAKGSVEVRQEYEG